MEGQLPFIDATLVPGFSITGTLDMITDHWVCVRDEKPLTLILLEQQFTLKELVLLHKLLYFLKKKLKWQQH